MRWITQHLTPLDGDQILPFLRDTSLSKEARRDVAEKVSFTYDEGIIEKLDNVDSSERKRNAQRVNQWQKSEILSEHSDFKWNEEEVPEKRDVVFYWRHDQ